MGEARDHQPVYFFLYPPVGGNDWRYTYATARVRALRAAAPDPGLLEDVARAGSLDAAADLLGDMPYALDSHQRSAAGVEEVLQARRTEARRLFDELVLDAPVRELFKARTDFVNIRLAIRRSVTDRPIGSDYASGGHVPPDAYTQAFEQDEYDAFPPWLQGAIERGVLAYFENRDLRALDHAVSQAQVDYNLGAARAAGSVFLEHLFRLETDENNLRTMLRLKRLGSDDRSGFIDGGFVDLELFIGGVEEPYESVAARFSHTPYEALLEAGAPYVEREDSFLLLEQRCEAYLEGYLAQAATVSAGLQPVVAYLLQTEIEIRRVRMVLLAALYDMDRTLVLDRLGHEE